MKRGGVKNKPCIWFEYDDMPGYWKTSCTNKWDGPDTPEEYGWKYCSFCGKKLKEESLQLGGEDEE